VLRDVRDGMSRAPRPSPPVAEFVEAMRLVPAV
jgi:hypothetical protein